MSAIYEPASEVTHLAADFESVDSTLFALLGVISVAQRTRRTIARQEAAPAAAPSAPHYTSDSTSVPDDLVAVLLGMVSLAQVVESQADTTFSATLNTETPLGSEYDTNESVSSPALCDRGLLR